MQQQNAKFVKTLQNLSQIFNCMNCIFSSDCSHCSNSRLMANSKDVTSVCKNIPSVLIGTQQTENLEDFRTQDNGCNNYENKK